MVTSEYRHELSSNALLRVEKALNSKLAHNRSIRIAPINLDRHTDKGPIVSRLITRPEIYNRIGNALDSAKSVYRSDYYVNENGETEVNVVTFDCSNFLQTNALLHLVGDTDTFFREYKDVFRVIVNFNNSRRDSAGFTLTYFPVSRYRM